MKLFNSVDPVLSIRDTLESLEKGGRTNVNEKLVELVAYCLNPNHYHFILKQLVDGGIAEFMKRLNGGYTWYFNKRNKRNGALFQGVYKSKHISNNENLLELSVYVNINDKVHKISSKSSQLVRSSWSQYVEGNPGMCLKDIILEQFKSPSAYRRYAIELLPVLHERKAEEKDLAKLMLE